MHSAPAVSYPVGRSRFHAGLAGSASLIGALAGLLWRNQADPAVWPQGVFALILFGSGLAAFQAWRSSPCGSLQWDGRGWSLTAAQATFTGLLSVHLDLQCCLLLCLRTQNGRRYWLWPERRRDGANWNALRRAVFGGNAGSLAAQAGIDDQRGRVKS